MSVIKAGTTVTTALVLEGNTDGDLIFKTGSAAVTAMSISASGVVTFPATTGFDIASANITNLTSGTTSATVLRSASATLTNLLATTLTVSGLGAFPLGASATPSIIFSGDPNTGIYSPAADNFAISTGGAERLRIDSVGNAGLNVTPSAWSGALGKGFLQLGSGSGRPTLALGTYDSGSIASGYIYSNAFYDGSNWKYMASTFAAGYEINGNVGQHIWYTAPSGTASNTVTFTERFRIDSAGNLGLNLTPSAWGTQFRALQSGAASYNSSIAFQTNDTVCNIFANAYYDGSNYKYVNSSQGASQYRVGNNNNAVGTGFTWSLAPSGTAGNNITFVEVMKLSGTTTANLTVGSSGISTGECSVEVGNGRTGSGYAYLDLVGDTTYTDYGLRILRDNGGANTNSLIAHRGTGALEIKAVEAGVVSFFTTNAERARILSGGEFCVNTTGLTNNGRLSVNTTTSTPAARFYSSGGDGAICVMIDKSSNTSTTAQWFLGFTIDNQVTASGVITANGASQAAFGTWSDKRLKENVVDLASQWSSIKALRPVEFDYIQSEGGGHQISFIAQEFEEVYPDAVGERPDGMKTLAGWGKTEARLVKALQEAMARIEKLESEMAELKGSN